MYMPKCLWCSTSFIFSLFIVKGRLTALLTFLEIKSDSDFHGLNLTNQGFAHLLRTSKSAFIVLAVSFGFTYINFYNPQTI